MAAEEIPEKTKVPNVNAAFSVRCFMSFSEIVCVRCMFKLRQGRNEILLFATKRPVSGVKCRFSAICIGRAVVLGLFKLSCDGENS